MKNLFLRRGQHFGYTKGYKDGEHNGFNRGIAAGILLTVGVGLAGVVSGVIIRKLKIDKKDLQTIDTIPTEDTEVTEDI